jgi:DNA end-binding protein Ku
MLRKGDLCPVRFARVCRADGKEIPREDIVKGYQYREGDYVVLTDKDFENANVEKTKTIDILDFVKELQIDPLYYEKPYYLEPQKSGVKSYVLLREALRKSKRVGIARFVIHNREHIGAIKPYEHLLVLNQLRYQEEIRPMDRIKVPSNGGVKAKELDMAITLIDHLTTDFKPKVYRDTYIEDLKRIIEQKAKGIPVRPKGEQPKPTNVKDLMKLLKTSIESQKQKAA